MLTKLLAFDAHNHVHLGPSSSSSSSSTNIWPFPSSRSSPLDENAPFHNVCCGMAIMSTHPRDFARVLELASSSSSYLNHSFADDDDDDDRFVIIPCIGVHPWFLNELLLDPKKVEGDDDENYNIDHLNARPSWWIAQMEDLLKRHPRMPVGEIGLDGFHFNNNNNDDRTKKKKELSTPMDQQIHAFEWQLDLAIRYQRPVSIHCVRAMGPTMDAISKVQQANHGTLPPAMYFHAFGGKLGTATQWIKTLEKKQKTRVFFGFAPIVNFQSPKTVQVIQEVGLDRLVLETDHEDAAQVAPSMELALQVISEILGVTEDELIRRTNQNVCQLYGIDGLPGTDGTGTGTHC